MPYLQQPIVLVGFNNTIRFDPFDESAAPTVVLDSVGVNKKSSGRN
jgi:hypothetical protein